MTATSLVPYLFKEEYSKLVSVLAKSFGLEHIEIAEDIASETFLLALDTWPYKEIPHNPTAWLYTVAKNKAINYLKRLNNFNHNISLGISTTETSSEMGVDFSEGNIADSQLQMFFTLCHPGISTESQICLALRILCGLGISEIADAFLTSKDVIHKRLQRAKQKLYSKKLKIELPEDARISERLDTVLHTIYLLFSEGYYSESNPAVIRKELCIEALNLTYLLLSNPLTNTHQTNALMSLMCFHFSRLDARQARDKSIILYDDQDRSLWDTSFIEKGFYYLQLSGKGEISSKYYIEASIAYWHTVENSNPDKWTSILKLYDVLLSFDNSPVVALNRIVAFSKVYGNKAAIREAELLKLHASHFYFILLSHLYKEVDLSASYEHLQAALKLCKSEQEIKAIQNHITEVERMLKQ